MLITRSGVATLLAAGRNSTLSSDMLVVHHLAITVAVKITARKYSPHHLFTRQLF